MGLGIVIMGIFSILFDCTEDLYMKGVFTLGMAIGASFQDVAVNVAALDCFRGPDVLMWVQSIHGCFGIGGLIGPYIVYIF